MKICIARSVATPGPAEPFSVTMDTEFSGRFIAHLTDRPGFCGSCGTICSSCRSAYHLDYSRDIAGIIDFPARLPGVVEEPGAYLPHSAPEADVLVAIAVNEEILIALAEQWRQYRAIIVPVEAPDWISPSAVARITAICAARGVETAFPRPFCTFAPESGVLAAFREYFKIGLPSVNITTDHGVIVKTDIQSSAPCGATYFTCRGLAGLRVDDNLELVADKRLSAYPCTASTAVDPEYRDSLIHKATRAQRIIVDRLKFYANQ
jgi:thymidylate synthase